MFLLSSFQFAQKSCHQQETLQIIRHQQTPTDSCSGLPEGQTEGRVEVRCSSVKHDVMEND